MAKGGKKKGKLKGAKKAEFLKRMAAGRRKAARKAEGKTTKRKTKSPKGSPSRMAARGAAFGAAHAAHAAQAAAAKKKSRKKPKKKKPAAAKKSGPSRTAARRRAKKSVSTHGTVVVGGKAQPINMRVQVGEAHRAKTKSRRRKSSGRRSHHVYENPMTGAELGVGMALAGIGMFGGSMLDRYLAIRQNGPVPAGGKPGDALGLAPIEAVSVPPGLLRVGAQGALAIVPLVGAHYSHGMVKSGLQGFSIGVGAGLIKQVVEFAIVRFLGLNADKTPNTGGFVAKIYPDQLNAYVDAQRATALLHPSGAMGLQGLPQHRGVGAPGRIPFARDPGPRAGVGETTGGGNTDNPPPQPPIVNPGKEPPPQWPAGQGGGQGGYGGGGGNGGGGDCGCGSLRGLGLKPEDLYQGAAE